MLGRILLFPILEDHVLRLFEQGITLYLEYKDLQLQLFEQKALLSSKYDVATNVYWSKKYAPIFENQSGDMDRQNR